MDACMKRAGVHSTVLLRITQCIFAQALYVFAVLAFPCHSRLLNSIPNLTLTLGRIFEVLIACERLPMLDVQREW